MRLLTKIVQVKSGLITLHNFNRNLVLKNANANADSDSNNSDNSNDDRRDDLPSICLKSFDSSFLARRRGVR